MSPNLEHDFRENHVQADIYETMAFFNANSLRGTFLALVYQLVVHQKAVWYTDREKMVYSSKSISAPKIDFFGELGNLHHNINV